MRSGVDLHFWPSLLAQLGAQPYAGYAIFEVDRSPGMEINAEATAFVSGNGRHFVFQVLPVEELPPYEKVFTTEPFPQGPPVDDSRRRVIQR